MTTHQQPLNIGFVGLGIMGFPMVGHLVAAGHKLSIYDVDQDRTAQVGRALDNQPTLAQSAQAVADDSDIVVTMLPNGEVVSQVVFGEQGLAQGFRPGSILLDTSSSQPWLTEQTAQQLARQQVTMVDAPVSGAQWGAEAAELVFMVGGAESDVERVRPVLDCLGKAVFHVGALGCGHAMKCLNNLITALTFSATAEGLLIGKRYGLDPDVMVDVLNASTGMSWISQTHIKQRITSRRFDDPFKLELMLKDVGIANALARETETSAPICALGQQLWQAASAAAGPGASISELARWVEKQSGSEITPGATPKKD